VILFAVHFAVEYLYFFAKIKDVLSFLNNYWPLIAAILTVIGVITTWAYRGTPLAEWWRHRQLYAKATDRVEAYCQAEKGMLRSKPSLIGEVPIDFSSDYVSLLIVAQPKHNVLAAKRAVDVNWVMTSENPVAVVGGPGCGKTTLLSHIEYMILKKRKERVWDQHRSIPVFIYAPEASPRAVSLRELIITKLDLGLPREEQEYLVARGLANGCFVLLIDAVDEIKEPIHEFAQKLMRFLSEFTQTHIVMSSRPISYDLEALTNASKTARSFMEVAVAPLSPEKKKALIAKYSKTPHDAAKVLELIATRPFLKDITRVTINLIMLIELVANKDQLLRRGDFYSSASRVLLYDLPQRKGEYLKYGYERKLALLARVSFGVLVNGAKFTSEAITTFGNDPESEQLFEEILKTSGLVKLVAIGKFSFPHRTFAEYFAAQYISKNFDSVSAEEWTRIYKNDTSEVIAFLANSLTNVDLLISRILKLPGNRLKALADCLANCQMVDPAVQKEAESVIMGALQDSPDLQVQSSAVRYVLSQIHCFPRVNGYKSIYVELEERLASPEIYANKTGVPADEIQTQALRLLVHTSSPEIVPFLINIFRRIDSDTYVLFKAAELLASLSDESILPDLQQAYAENNDPDVSRFVVEAIVRTKSKHAIPALQFALKDDDRVVRDLAKEGISQITANRFIEDATIISNTGGEKSEKSVVPGCDLSPDELLTLVQDSLFEYRLDAFFSLRSACPTDREQELYFLAMNESENEFFRCEAVRLLGTRPTTTCAKMLEEIFRDSRNRDPSIAAGARGCAIEYLAHRGYRENVLNCINDCDFSACLPNEQCKIVWSIYEVLRAGQGDLTQIQYMEIKRLCSQYKGDDNSRISHWIKRIDQCLRRFYVSGATPQASEV
jgi:HEAT repeat protein/energy-coupling factor transporter ATP-binding protein EcfA2